MDDSQPKNLIEPNTTYLNRETTKVCDFTTLTKHYNTDVLTNILLIYIINKIKAIHIPITNIDDRIA